MEALQHHDRTNTPSSPSLALCLSSCQVTTARSVSGTWRARRASRSSPLTARSLRSRSTTWHSTLPSATSAVRALTRSLRSSYDLEVFSAADCRAQRTSGVMEGRCWDGKGRSLSPPLSLDDEAVTRICPIFVPLPPPSDLGWPGSWNKHTSACDDEWNRKWQKWKLELSVH